MSEEIIIVWFRQDLRIDDNPALLAAHKSQRQILPLFILDDEITDEWKMGSASRWWLHNSLLQLNASLKTHLCLQMGEPLTIFKRLIKEHNIKTVYWNKCYEPFRITADKQLKEQLRKDNIEVQCFNSTLIFEPHTTLKEDKTPYKVFTPYYKRCLEKSPEPALPVSSPRDLNLCKSTSLSLVALQLKPEIEWYRKMDKVWKPGEKGAEKCLDTFLGDGLKGYKAGRDFPSQTKVSRLSPHLHFGEISPNRVWHEVKSAMCDMQCEKDGEHFLRELGWREFANNLLFHFPDLPEKNLQRKFDAFPWQEDATLLRCWQTGQTGYPIVDAGMRELWQTGYMHNRVRMIVGSFLVKNLLLHWRYGEKWFWDTLLDADLANNSVSWQWIAGCGADAAPYFRIFNPVTQGEKFDKEGIYVRKYVPEIAKLPNKFLHSPWLAPASVLDGANMKLGIDYPKPVVDLKESRERALTAFKQMSGI